MNRKDITKLLTDTLINTRLSDRKYYAKEVTLDYGTNHSKRIDVVQFEPSGVTYAGDIEKVHLPVMRLNLARKMCIRVMG